MRDACGEYRIRVRVNVRGRGREGARDRCEDYRVCIPCVFSSLCPHDATLTLAPTPIQDAHSVSKAAMQVVDSQITAGLSPDPLFPHRYLSEPLVRPLTELNGLNGGWMRPSGKEKSSMLRINDNKIVSESSLNELIDSMQRTRPRPLLNAARGNENGNQTNELMDDLNNLQKELRMMLP